MHNGSTLIDQRGRPRRTGRNVYAILTIVFATLALAQNVRSESLLFFAAASTGRAVTHIVELYEAQNPHTVRISLAASSTLAVQIANGAPADIFLSANAQWMDYLAQKRAIVHRSRVNLLGNRLALISASDNPVDLKISRGFALADALGDRRLSLADPDHVPAGIYAKTALEKLGVWHSVRTKLARTANVRAAVLLIARGETSLGVGYTSDVVNDASLRVVDVFPADTHPPITYPLALVGGPKTTAALTFANFLVSQQARGVFDQHGFRLLVD